MTRSLFLLLFACLLPEVATGCRCAERNLSEYFAAADFVAAAKLQNIEVIGDDIRMTLTVVGLPYKVEATEQAREDTVTVVTTASGASCGVMPFPNSIYILFAYREPGTGTMRVDTCSGTRLHSGGHLDEPVGFVDVPPQFVVKQLDGLAAMQVLRDIQANAPDSSDPANTRLVGLLDLKALAHGGHTDVYAEPDRHSDRIARVREWSEIASREVGYEVQAAIVVARSDDWYRVRLADARYGWIAATDAGTWFPYAELPLRRLSYATREWSGFVWPQPGAGIPNRNTILPGDESDEVAVDVIEQTTVGGMTWFRVNVLRRSVCDGGESESSLSGWIPAYGRSGQPNIWYWSRGC